MVCCLLLPATATFEAQAAKLESPIQIVEKMKQAMAPLKDAEGDITLDYNIRLFGCSGNHRLTGKAYFKAPYWIRAEINGVTYWAKGNRIRKIDEHGKKWYVKLIDAIDLNVGFGPQLITHNFTLNNLGFKNGLIELEGIPKPGRIKNVTKVFFYIDPEHYFLRELDIKFVNKSLGGKLKVDWQKIDGVWAPVSFDGDSAVVLPGGFLAGMGIKLSGTKVKLNQGIAQEVFEPGF